MGDVTSKRDGPCLSWDDKRGCLNTSCDVKILKFKQVVWRATHVPGLQVDRNVIADRKYRKFIVGIDLHIDRPTLFLELSSNVLTDVLGDPRTQAKMGNFKKTY